MLAESMLAMRARKCAPSVRIPAWRPGEGLRALSELRNRHRQERDRLLFPGRKQRVVFARQRLGAPPEVVRESDEFVGLAGHRGDHHDHPDDPLSRFRQPGGRRCEFGPRRRRWCPRIFERSVPSLCARLFQQFQVQLPSDFTHQLRAPLRQRPGRSRVRRLSRPGTAGSGFLREREISISSRSAGSASRKRSPHSISTIVPATSRSRKPALSSSAVLLSR